MNSVVDKNTEGTVWTLEGPLRRQNLSYVISFEQLGDTRGQQDLKNRVKHSKTVCWTLCLAICLTSLVEVRSVNAAPSAEEAAGDRAVL